MSRSDADCTGNWLQMTSVPRQMLEQAEQGRDAAIKQASASLTEATTAEKQLATAAIQVATAKAEAATAKAEAATATPRQHNVSAGQQREAHPLSQKAQVAVAAALPVRPLLHCMLCTSIRCHHARCLS